MEDILRQNGLDPNRFSLGRLCRRSHRWNGMERSLRYRHKNNACVECSRTEGRRKRQENIPQSVKDARAAKLKADEYWEQHQDAFLAQFFIDSRMFRLGTLCKRSHDFEGTGRSLRHRGSSGNCRDCELARHGLEGTKPRALLEEIGILEKHGVDPSVFKLTKPCINGHNWNGTGKSLRYRDNTVCIDCAGIKKFGSLKGSLEEQFWYRVDKRGDDECWPWLGSRNMSGYGRMNHKKKYYPAHRLSYTLANGEIPEGMCVCHKCDNPPCVNPRHLFAGTNADNASDRAFKGRGQRGSRSPRAKLTESDIPKIFEDAKTIKDLDLIAQKYGVTKTTIQNVLKRRFWLHVKIEDAG